MLVAKVKANGILYMQQGTEDMFSAIARVSAVATAETPPDLQALLSDMQATAQAVDGTLRNAGSVYAAAKLEYDSLYRQASEYASIPEKIANASKLYAELKLLFNQSATNQSGLSAMHIILGDVLSMGEALGRTTSVPKTATTIVELREAIEKVRPGERRLRRSLTELLTGEQYANQRLFQLSKPQLREKPDGLSLNILVDACVTLLGNMIVELKGLHVYVRVNNFNGKGGSIAEDNAVIQSRINEVKDYEITFQSGKSKPGGCLDPVDYGKFIAVYDGDKTNQDIFCGFEYTDSSDGCSKQKEVSSCGDEAQNGVKQLVKRVLDKQQNAVLLAYGSSGSGKTHTLLTGGNSDRDKAVLKGIIDYLVTDQRSLELQVFEYGLDIDPLKTMSSPGNHDKLYDAIKFYTLDNIEKDANKTLPFQRLVGNLEVDKYVRYFVPDLSAFLRVNGYIYLSEHDRESVSALAKSRGSKAVPFTTEHDKFIVAYTTQEWSTSPERHKMMSITQENIADVPRLIHNIDKVRKAQFRVCPTMNNPDSSRSHLFIRLKASKAGATSTFTVCDLAGSENPQQLMSDLFQTKLNEDADVDFTYKLLHVMAQSLDLQETAERLQQASDPLSAYTKLLSTAMFASTADLSTFTSASALPGKVVGVMGKTEAAAEFPNIAKNTSNLNCDSAGVAQSRAGNEFAVGGR